MATLILRRLSSSRWRYVPVLPLFVLAQTAPPNGRLRPWANRTITRIALHGVGRKEYLHLCADTAAVLRDRRTQPLISELLAHGGRIVVVTASERELAASFLREIGMTHVELIASTMRFDHPGARFVRHNHGAEKVRALQRAQVDLAAARFFTDSASDLPLIRRVGSTVLVQPSARSRRAIQRGAPGVHVVVWGS